MRRKRKGEANGAREQKQMPMVASTKGRERAEKKLEMILGIENEKKYKIIAILVVCLH
jgi:diphthamide synthase subunit DPH2